MTSTTTPPPRGWRRAPEAERRPRNTKTCHRPTSTDMHA